MDGWMDAMLGCRYVWHVASPVPSEPPKHEDDLIIPARDGTLRVLRAASEAGVERIVLTSSLSAVMEGHPRDPSRIFTEEDWSRLDGDLSAYDKSKTLAERAAWDFVESLAADKTLELSVINPGLVLGPVLEKDVAAAHFAAMTVPEANGKRFCCCGRFVWMKEMAEILNANFGEKGYKVPTRTLPDFVVRIVGLFDKLVRVTTPRLGLELNVSNERIKSVLGWQPRSTEEMIVATGQSLIDLGLV
jgi:nucleoside-diphosphate-sugar epimerase